MDSEGYVVIFGFILALVWMSNRTKERQNRLRVLEQALRSGALTAQQQRDLADELAGRPRRSGIPFFSRAAFVLGWLGLFVAGGFILYEELDSPRDSCDYDTVGFLVAAGSFAVLSLPIALREFERRHPGRERT
ncbi:MAG: hypothetical protein AAF196_03645 [Planctomycetota bacterium]